MKIWKIILSLIIFFPLGVYFMFQYTDWPKKNKWIISLIGSFIFGLLLVSESIYIFTLFSGLMITLISVIMFIFAILKRKQKRTVLLALLFGLILSSYSINTISEQEAETDRIAIELQLEEEKLKKETLEEERLAEEKKQMELEEKYLGIATESVAKVETEPTKENYDEASTLVDELSKPNRTLITRLEKIKPDVEKYEAAINETLESIKKAETDLTKESYDSAVLLSSNLLIKNNEVTKRLNKVEEKLNDLAEKKAEAERVARDEAEKAETERLTNEKAEADRVAQEKKKSADTSTDNSSINQQNTPSDNVSKIVYIAPQSGEKYHLSSNCRGLSKANSIVEISINEAKQQGYGLCGWED